MLPHRSPSHFADGKNARVVVFFTAAGWVGTVWHDTVLGELTFGFSTPEEAVRALRQGSGDPTPACGLQRTFVARVQAFFEDAQDDFLDVELDLSERTPFQQKVLEACRRIPPGETISYGELALRAGSPRAARAAGQVMATNRFPLIIPCHRVVGSGGSLGGYSARSGLRMKRWLLDLERSGPGGPAPVENAAAADALACV